MEFIFHNSYSTVVWVLVKVRMAKTHRVAKHVRGWRIWGALSMDGCQVMESLAVEHNVTWLESDTLPA
jgi:hypothetical protein